MSYFWKYYRGRGSKNTWEQNYGMKGVFLTCVYSHYAYALLGEVSTSSDCNHGRNVNFTCQLPVKSAIFRST